MVATGLRYLLLPALLVAAVGLTGHLVEWPTLASTVGPTAYVFAAHPDSEAARLRNALVGHGVALAAGLASLAAFGLWSSPSMTTRGYPSLIEIGASAVAVGITLAVLEVLRLHHAPAAATALLVSTGLASPGKPLVGLVVGLAVVIALGPLIGRLRPSGRARHEIEREASQ